MRLFIALELSDNCKRLLNKKVKIIKQTINQPLNWVEPKKWHLTLKFLGATSKDKLSQLEELITETCQNKKEFPLQFAGINAFPHIKKPRVIYFETKEGSKDLKNLYTVLENNLITAGFDEDNRNFTPHLTIARTCDDTKLSILNENLSKIRNDLLINIYDFANKITLFKSNLLPEGPVYEKKFTFKLKNT